MRILVQPEYYEGILFLPTNRIKTIEEAIVSRIHLPLRYINLNKSPWKKVWQSFLHIASSANVVTRLAVKDIKYLAKMRLNRRQVRSPHSREALLRKPLYRRRMPFQWRTLMLFFPPNVSRRKLITFSVYILRVYRSRFHRSTTRPYR